MSEGVPGWQLFMGGFPTLRWRSDPHIGHSNPMAQAPSDYDVQPVIPDGVQDLAWSPTANVLVAGSWDNLVRCWEVQQQGQQFHAAPKAQISHDGPVLCTAFSADGSTVFSGSCDKTAKMWALNGPAQGQQIAAHDAPIKGIAQVQEANCVVTGSWDKTVKYWDTRSPTPMATVNLSERCYAMDAKYPLLVVATANLSIDIFDMRKPSVVYKTVTSNLKYQTRTIACFPDGSGFAVGSIEGRCAVMHVEGKDKKSDYAFRAHREGHDVFAINSISFHPYGTVATAGSDGSFCFWDLKARQKLKTFPKLGEGIAVGKFNARGDIYAYAVSYDWSKGAAHYTPTRMRSTIRLHATTDAEIKPRKSVR